ncbi:MAG: hypothetical protein HY556_11005 [Euryarchaeota archaeon]|nr:hypothetical protein [Euryarchaeota archaeon]
MRLRLGVKKVLATLIVALLLMQPILVLDFSSPLGSASAIETPLSEPIRLTEIAPSQDPYVLAQRAAKLANYDWRLGNVLTSLAIARGLDARDPVLPDVSGDLPLVPALLALSSATGRSAPTDAELLKAAELPPNLQRALALIVVSASKAAKMQTEAMGGATGDQLVSLANGGLDDAAASALLKRLDLARSYEAALLMDSAVEAATPTLKGWSALLTSNPTTRRAVQASSYPLEMAITDSPTSALEAYAFTIASSGRNVPSYSFVPRITPVSKAIADFYKAAYIPANPDDGLALLIADQAVPQKTADLVSVNINALTDALQLERQAFARLTPDDISWLKSVSPQVEAASGSKELLTEDQSRTIQRVADLVSRVDLEALTRAASTLLGASEYSTNNHIVPGVDDPDGVPSGPPSPPGDPTGAVCPGGTTPNQPNPGDPDDANNTRVRVPCTTVFIQNRGNANGTRTVGIDTNGDGVYEREFTSPSVASKVDLETLAVIIYDDENNDGAPQENEIDFNSQGVVDPANNVIFHDPYGFFIVGGENETRFDKRYAKVNYYLVPLGRRDDALGAYNGSIGPLSLRDAVNRIDAFSAPPALLPGGSWTMLVTQNMTYPPNITVNPGGYNFLTLDMGGNDTYVNNIGGTGDNEVLFLMNMTSSYYVESAHGNRSNTVRGGPLPGLFGNNPLCYLYDFNTYILLNNGNIGYCRGPDDRQMPGAGPPRPGSQAELYVQVQPTAALAVDLGGNDNYRNETGGNYTVGSGIAGIGVLYDAAGNDSYSGLQNSTAASYIGVGIIADLAGDDDYYSPKNGTSIARIGGTSLIYDAGGNDTYYSGEFGIGVGIFGTAAILEKEGDDKYLWSDGISTIGRGYPTLGVVLDFAGDDEGFRTNTRAEAGGVGTSGNVQPMEAEVASFSAATTGLEPIEFYEAANRSRAGGIALDMDLERDDSTSLDGAHVQRKSTETVDFKPRLSTPSFYNISFALYVDTPGLFQLSTEADSVLPGSYVLQVDLGGSDTYLGRVGTAIIELNATTNTTRYDEVGTVTGGSEHFFVNSTNSFFTPVALAIDVSGSDTYGLSATSGIIGNLGFGLGGIGMLFDLSASDSDFGRDTYNVRGYGEGAGTVFGIGVLVDERGDDIYTSRNVSRFILHEANQNASRAQGFGDWGGVGLLMDRSGSDTYEALQLSQGAVHATLTVEGGVLYDGGGEDTYRALARSQGFFNSTTIGTQNNRSSPYRFGQDYRNGRGLNDQIGSQLNGTQNSQAVPEFGAGLFIDDGYAQDNYNSTLAAFDHRNDWQWKADGGDGRCQCADGKGVDMEYDLGRGIDNPDHYANWLLVQADGETAIRHARAVLLSPSVRIIEPTGSEPFSVSDTVNVRAKANFGLHSILVNSDALAQMALERTAQCLNGNRHDIAFPTEPYDAHRVRALFDDLTSRGGVLMNNIGSVGNSNVPVGGDDVAAIGDPAINTAVGLVNCRGFGMSLAPLPGPQDLYNAVVPMGPSVAPGGGELVLDTLNIVLEAIATEIPDDDAKAKFLVVKNGINHALGAIDDCRIQYVRDAKDCALGEASKSIRENTTYAITLLESTSMSDFIPGTSGQGLLAASEGTGRVDRVDFFVEGVPVAANLRVGPVGSSGIYGFEWRTLRLASSVIKVSWTTELASDSTVHYVTDDGTVASVHDAALTTEHELEFIAVGDESYTFWANSTIGSSAYARTNLSTFAYPKITAGGDNHTSIGLRINDFAVSLDREVGAPLYPDSLCDNFGCFTYNVTALAYLKGFTGDRATGDSYGLYPGESIVKASVNNLPRITEFEVTDLNPGSTTFYFNATTSEPAEYEVRLSGDDLDIVLAEFQEEGSPVRVTTRYFDVYRFMEDGFDDFSVQWDGRLTDGTFLPEGEYVLTVALKDRPVDGARRLNDPAATTLLRADKTAPMVSVLTVPCHTYLGVCYANGTSAPAGTITMKLSGDLAPFVAGASPIKTTRVYVKEMDVDAGSTSTCNDLHLEYANQAASVNWCKAGDTEAYSDTFVYEGISEGLHRYSFIAFGIDQAGNVESGLATFLAAPDPFGLANTEATTTLDTTVPPLQTLSSPVSTGTTATSVTWELDDRHADTVGARLYYGIQKSGATSFSIREYRTFTSSVDSTLFDALEAGESVGDGDVAVFQMRAEDRAGNLGPAKVSQTAFDFRAPTVIGGEAPAELTHQSVIIKWATSEPSTSKVEFAPLGGETLVPVEAETDEDGTIHSVTLTSLSAGATYVYRIVATDVVGNSNTTALREFATNPVISARILSPEAGAILEGDSTVLYVLDQIVEDNFVTYEVRLSVDGGLTFPHALRPRFNAYDFPPVERAANFDSARFPDTPRAVARLIVNNSLNGAKPLIIDSPVFTIDNSPPTTTLNVSGSQDLSSWRNSTVTVSFETKDAGSGVEATLYSLDNVTFKSYDGPFAFTREGESPIFFKSIDVAGHSEAATVGSIRIDRTPPTLKAVLNAGDTHTGTSSVKLFLSASDSLSGVSSARVFNQGGVELPVDNPDIADGITLNWPLPKGDGSKVVFFRVGDNAGNSITTKDAIIVDTTPPEVTDFIVEKREFTSVVVVVRTNEYSTAAVGFAETGGSDFLGEVKDNILSRSHRITLASLRPGTDYSLRLVVADQVGNVGAGAGGASTVEDKSPPGVPGELRASDLRNGLVRLNWRAATDDVGVSHYLVQRSEDNRNFVTVAFAEGLNFVDDSAVPAVPYYYRIVAQDRAGNIGSASRSAVVKATTAPTLSAGMVSPESGDGATSFTFSVVYRDLDNDPPAFIRVIVDGKPYDMRKAEQSVEFRSGVKYSLATHLDETRLSTGTHSFHFASGDGLSRLRYPAFHDSSGPAVVGSVSSSISTDSITLPGLKVNNVPGFETVAFAVALVAAAVFSRRRVP